MIARSTDHAASDTSDAAGEGVRFLIDAGILPHPDAALHRETDEKFAAELAKRAGLTMPQLRAALAPSAPTDDLARVTRTMRELGWLGTRFETYVRFWAEDAAREAR